MICDTWYFDLKLETWYLIPFTCDTWYLILGIWYSIFDTLYLLLNIWYLIHSRYIISDTRYLTLWYWDLDTCILLLATFYLLTVAYYLILTGTCFLILSVWYLLLLKLAITCKKIASFRSCSATRSCFVYQVKGVYCIISNKIISLTISRGKILPHKMTFFRVFENDNILSSKSYTVTKSEIYPQLKLGSLRNLRFFL